MSYTKQPYTKAAARPSTGAPVAEASTAAAGEKNPATQTTHYVKNTDKGFVDNVQCWENEGQFGSYLKIRVSETLAPGDYYISARKGHVSKV